MCGDAAVARLGNKQREKTNNVVNSCIAAFAGTRREFNRCDALREKG
jgi:hypothetical protein